MVTTPIRSKEEIETLKTYYLEKMTIFPTYQEIVLIISLRMWQSKTTSTAISAVILCGKHLAIMHGSKERQAR